MNRPILVCLALCLLLLLGAGVLPAAEAPSRPNIVVILVDDMGFSDIGCYGSEIPTPNLDKLAGEGLRFTQFYNTSRCCPTRAVALDGPLFAPGRHGTHDGGPRRRRLPRRPQQSLRDHRRGAADRRLPHGDDRQVACHEARRRGRCVAEIQLAAAARLRPLFRHHPGRRGLFPAGSADQRERSRAAGRRFLYHRRLRRQRRAVRGPGRPGQALLPLYRLQRPALPSHGPCGRDREIPR